MGNTPNIRFKGFTDDWEQRKVLDLLIQPVTDGPHETPELVEEGVPFISVDAIVDNKIDFSRKRGNISEKYDELCCKKYKPQLHDVYLVKSGSTVGKVAIVETTEKFNIWSPLAAMRCGDKTYPYFLYNLLQTKDLQAQVADKASNGTQPNLSMRELEKFPVCVPSNIEEQKKIGAYFEQLDNLITLHQRKCDETKELKKFMLQKMFPKKGEKKPEIRFAGFTDDWEQRKLGEMGITFTGLSGKTADDFGHGEASFITYMNVFSNPVANPKMVEKVEIDAKQKEVQVGDVFFTTSSETPEEVGMSCVLKEKQGVTYLNSFCFGYRPTEKFDLDYLAYMLRSDNVRKDITFLAQGISRYNISKNKVMDIAVPVPKFDEQQQIGSYFSNLDHLITLHQRKYYELKILKKYMIKNMFA